MLLLVAVATAALLLLLLRVVARRVVARVVALLVAALLRRAALVGVAGLALLGIICAAGVTAPLRLLTRLILARSRVIWRTHGA